MPSVPLPGFGGLSFFTAAVRQQRQAQGCLLPVPPPLEQEQPEHASLAEAEQDPLINSISTDKWVLQARQLARDLGHAEQPIAAVAATAPRSKAERAATKRARAEVWQQVQPALKTLSSNSTTNTTTAGATAGCTTEAPSLAQVAARHVTSFAHGSSHAGSINSSCSSSEVLQLEVPVIPASDTPWGKDAFMHKGPTKLLCEPQELQQLWLPIPPDTPTSEWEPAYTRVCKIPPGGGTAVEETTSTAATGDHTTNSAALQTAAAPSVAQLLHQWVVLQQARTYSSRPAHPETATLPAAHSAATAAETPAAVEGDEPPSAADAATAADGAIAARKLSADPAGCKLPPRGMALFESVAMLEQPALGFSWLQLQDGGSAATAAAEGSGSACCGALAGIQALAVQEQAAYHNSIVAAGSAAGCLFSVPEGFTSLQVGSRAASKGLQQQQQHLVLPSSVLPAAIPVLHRGTNDNSAHQQQQQQPAGQNGAAASILSAPAVPTARQLLHTWLAERSRTRPKDRSAAAPGSSRESRINRRGSAAALKPSSHGRNTPRVSKRSKPLAAAASPGLSRAAPHMQDAAAAAADKPPAPDAAAPAAEQEQQSQQQEEEAEERASSQAAVSTEAGSTQASEDECSVQLSPGSLLIEVPVCMPEQPTEPVSVQLLHAALSVAQAVLELHPAEWGAAGEAAAPAAAPHDDAVTAGEDSVSAQQWDASWGNLGLQQGAAVAAAGSAVAGGWCTPAVVSMLSETAGAQGGGSTTGASGTQQQQEEEGGQRVRSGAELLQQMVAADMQLGDDKHSHLQLPVVLFPDRDSGWSTHATDSTHGSICRELVTQCGYKRQPTAHLELYFDWSLLQPKQHQLWGSSTQGKRTSMLGSAAAKRLKGGDGGPSAAPWHQQQQQQAAAAGWDPDAWLHTLLHADGLQKLQQDLRKRVCVPGGSDSSQQLPPASWFSRQALAGYLLQPSTTPYTAGEESVPAEVAAASAAWRRAVGEAAAATADAHAAAHAAVAAAAAAAPSDLGFFMSLQQQQQGGQRGKKRVSAAAKQGADKTSAAAAAVGGEAGCQEALDSVPPVVATKRARASVQQEAADVAEQNQKQQELAAATADLALNGVLLRAAAADADGASDAAAVGPSVLQVELPASILRLLLQLDSMRQSVLASLDCPGPELVESLLWQDAAAQQMLLRHKAQQLKHQQETGQGPSAQQRQQNKALVVLVLLSQTAACLLHYGVRVAHMFLQHGLQRLPSVSDACRPALLALSAAAEALDQLPKTPAVPTAGASGGSASNSSSGRTAGEHPKLAVLKRLVLRLKSAQPDCKVLVVAESKAFFNLYHTLSAAGIIAVQLDRDRRLPAAYPPAGDSNSAAAQDPSHAAAWQEAVKSALVAASCVLATHEQLCHPCMPYSMFGALIEYVALADTASTATAAAAQGCDSTSQAVSSHFSPGKHFVLQVQQPDLQQAAAAAEAARTGAQQPGLAAHNPAATASDTTAAALAAAATAGAAAAVDSEATASGAREERPQNALPPEAPTTAAAVAAAAAVEAAAADSSMPEVPLVLNVSPGSLVKQRQPLYQSLMQLEMQGYVLVERALSNSSSKSSAAETEAAAAVDVVLTPKACLCIWTESKLPQDSELALQCLSRTLLALSMCYDSVVFVLELGPNLLQPIMHSSSNLQGLAKAVGVKLQLLACFSAANTQDAVLHVCKAAPGSFWASSTPPQGNNNSFSLQPPQGLTDLPCAAEVQLGSCSALNPLSAAVLASHGADLRSLFEVAVSDECAQHVLLQACLPARSLQLLQAQACAVAEHIQQQRQQQQAQHEQQDLLTLSPTDQQMGPGLQYNHDDRMAAAAAAAAAGHGYHAQQQPAMQPQQQQWQPHPGLDGFEGAGLSPVDMQAGPPAGSYMRPQPHHAGMPHQQYHQQQQEQLWQQQDGGELHYQDQQQQQAQYFVEEPDGVLMRDMPDVDVGGGWEDHDADGEQEQGEQLPQAYHRAQAQQQQRSAQPGMQGEQYGRDSCLPALGVDPSSVLDSFLSSRGAAEPAGRAGMGWAGGVSPMPTSYRGQQQQYSRGAAAGPAAAARGARHAAAQRYPQQQQQQHTPGMFGDAGSRGAADILEVRHDHAASPTEWDDQVDDMPPPAGVGWEGYGGGAQHRMQQQPQHRADPRLQPFMVQGGGSPDELQMGMMQQQQQQHMPNRHMRRQPQQHQVHGGSVFAGRGRHPAAVDEEEDDEMLMAPPPQRAGAGGMFAAAAAPTSRSRQRQTRHQAVFDDDDDDTAFGAAAAAPAAAGGYRGPSAAPAAAAAGFGGRGGMQSAGRKTTSSNNTSSLSVPAFMPHRKPSKQLKYTLPLAGAAGVSKRKKKGNGGLQTKLCWG